MSSEAISFKFSTNIGMLSIIALEDASSAWALPVSGREEEEVTEDWDDKSVFRHLWGYCLLMII